jgi:hypothetical protein
MGEGLRLREDVLDEGGRALRVLSDARSARAHVRDHLLTAPESDAWAQLLEVSGLDYSALVGGAARTQREACSRVIFAQESSCQRLYDVYAEQIAQAVRFAVKERWYGEAREQVGYMGVSGVVVFASQGRLATAYLPIFHMDESVRPADHDTPALKREGLARWRRGNPMYGESFAGSAQRRFYDDVFAPSWGAVSRWLWDRPLGSGASRNKATQDALARALKERWRGKTPHLAWWLKAAESSLKIQEESV